MARRNRWTVHTTEDIHTTYGGQQYHFHRNVFVDEEGWEYRNVVARRNGLIVHEFHSALLGDIRVYPKERS